MRLIGPSSPTADQLLPYLRRIDESGVHANGGPMDLELRTRVAEMTSVKHVTTVANATIGLELALRAHAFEAKARRRWLVGVSAVTYKATALAIERAGMLPYPIDVGRALQLTPELAFAAIANATVVIDAFVPVCPFGQRLADGWAEFSQESGLPVIIDAAGGINHPYHYVTENMSVVWSLHATKPISAGEGGLVGTGSMDVCNLIDQAKQFCCLTRKHQEAMMPTNAKMSEYSCAVALASIDGRFMRAGKLRRVEGEYRSTPLGPHIFGEGLYWTGVLCVDCGSSVSRASVEKAMLAESIPTKRWYHPYPFSGDRRLPVAAAAEANLLGLPFYPDMTADEVHKVARVAMEAML